MSQSWPDDERLDGPPPTPSLFAARWGELGRGLSAMFWPRDAADCRARLITVALTVTIAVAAGDWLCTGTDPRWGTWWVCGLSAISSAAAITGWVGGRFPFVLPFLLPMLTLPLVFVSAAVAGALGHRLDGLYGINMAVLSVFACFVGLAALIPATVLWAVRTLRTPD